MSYTAEQLQWMSDMRKKRELEKLQRLQQQYPTAPDYANMNLQDELRTRFDMDEMNQLQQKYGEQQQTPFQPKQTITPVPPMPYTPIYPLQPMDDTAKSPQNNATSPVPDMDLVNRMYEPIKVNEGFKDYPYYDTTWNQTLGTGINVSNRKIFDAMDWRDMNNPSRKATQEEKDACWNNLLQEKARLQSKASTPQRNKYRAEYFEPFCNIRVSEDAMKKVYTNHMLKDLSVIRRKIPNFDSLAPRIQNVIMDRIYNMGAPTFAKQTEFLKYASSNDLQGLSQEAETSPIAAKRKQWVRNHLK